jgi:hypothetical protein
LLEADAALIQSWRPLPALVTAAAGGIARGQSRIVGAFWYVPVSVIR